MFGQCPSDQPLSYTLHFFHCSNVLEINELSAWSYYTDQATSGEQSLPWDVTRTRHPTKSVGYAKHYKSLPLVWPLSRPALLQRSGRDWDPHPGD